MKTIAAAVKRLEAHQHAGGYVSELSSHMPRRSCRPAPRRARPGRRWSARGVPPLWGAAAVAFVLLALLVALGTGPIGIGWGAIAQSALAKLPLLHVHSPLGALDNAIVWQLRAPRVALGALVGGMLAVAGASYQGVFRNPLADPYLLGVAAGAGLGATLAIAYDPGGRRARRAAAGGGVRRRVVAVAAAYVLGRSVGGRARPRP